MHLISSVALLSTACYLVSGFKFSVEVYQSHRPQSLGFRLLVKESPSESHISKSDRGSIVTLARGFLSAQDKNHALVNHQYDLSELNNQSSLLFGIRTPRFLMGTPQDAQYYMQFEWMKESHDFVTASFLLKNQSTSNFQKWPVFNYAPENNTIFAIPLSDTEMKSFSTALPEDTYPCLLMRILTILAILANLYFVYKIVLAIDEYSNGSYYSQLDEEACDPPPYLEKDGDQQAEVPSMPARSERDPLLPRH